jgi:hypothetical protein
VMLEWITSLPYVLWLGSVEEGSMLQQCRGGMLDAGGALLGH